MIGIGLNGRIAIEALNLNLLQEALGPELTSAVTDYTTAGGSLYTWAINSGSWMQAPGTGHLLISAFSSALVPSTEYKIEVNFPILTMGDVTMWLIGGGSNVNLGTINTPGKHVFYHTALDAHLNVRATRTSAFIGTISYMSVKAKL